MSAKSVHSFCVPGLLFAIATCAACFFGLSTADLVGNGTLDFLHISYYASKLSEYEEYGVISTNSYKFPFGPSTVPAFYMTRNGYFEMGSSPLFSLPPEIPGFFKVSPYGALTSGGTIRYTEFSDHDPHMSTVNRFIESNIRTKFNGTHMMTGEWNRVRKTESSYYDTTSSTFQAVLITNGTSSYAVFIYDCGGMNWNGAVIGWAYSNSYSEYDKHSLSGSRSDQIGCYYSRGTSQNSAIIYRIDFCYSSQLVCANQQCVYGSRCNNFIECDDGSDEIGCSISCSRYELTCANQQCVIGSRCDSFRDCDDGSDEEGCVSVGLAVGLSVGGFFIFIVLPIVIVTIACVRQRWARSRRITTTQPSTSSQTTSFTNYQHHQYQQLQQQPDVNCTPQGYIPVANFPLQQPTLQPGPAPATNQTEAILPSTQDPAPKCDD